MEELTKEKKRHNLKKLISHLEWVQAESPASFNLGDWLSVTTEDDEVEGEIKNIEDDLRNKYTDRQPLECGFSGCVVGHLPLAFPDVFKWELDVVTTINNECGDGDPYISEERMMANYFGGTNKDWERVIYGYNYKSPEDIEKIQGEKRISLSAVIRRIRELSHAQKENNEN